MSILIKIPGMQIHVERPPTHPSTQHQKHHHAIYIMLSVLASSTIPLPTTFHIPLLKEPIHNPTPSRQQHTKPPPLISPNIPIHALKQHFMRRKIALHFASRRRRSNERMQRGGGQHFRGRVGEVHGHEGGAVGLVEVQALDFVVAVDGDFVLLLK
jgi:hypothetical protein